MVKYKCYGDTGREGKKWEDELLAGVMAWCLVHWIASGWGNGLVLGALDCQSLGSGSMFQTEVCSFLVFPPPRGSPRHLYLARTVEPLYSGQLCKAATSIFSSHLLRSLVI